MTYINWKILTISFGLHAEKNWNQFPKKGGWKLELGGAISNSGMSYNQSQHIWI